jgi:Colicin V production protein
VEVLQRLQALDILFAIIWAGIVGWGLQTGIIRQLGMLVAVYGAALVSGSVYREGGAALALIVGADLKPQLEFAAYVATFAIIFGLIGLIIWRAYPASRFKRGFGTENVGGAALGAVWGVLFLIALLTILRFYTVVPWKGQETSQQGVLRQIQLSQVAPVLQVVAAPLWQVMVPWFPAPVNGRL